MAPGPRLRTLTRAVTLPDGRARAFSTVARQPFPFLLEGAGAYTLLGADPFRLLIAKGDQVTEWRAGRSRTRRADPFDVLREALAEHRVEEADPRLPFAGGAVGYLGYPLGRHIERLPERAVDDRGFPDMVLGFYDRAFLIDHATGRSSVVELSEREPARALSLQQYEKEFRPLGPLHPSGAVGSNFSREAYLRAVGRVKEYIAAGDVYQVNLSQRFHAATPALPFEIYEKLRATSPAPHSAFLEFGRRAIISSSPELFLEARQGRVVTRPIKGTRPRGSTPVEDERLRQELIESEKDNAELAMIVDLERNDLGRVCEYGSVRVTQERAVETHPTVHHLVASVEGRLRPDVDAVDLLCATFPGGSITGAPKIRAMEIIDELEPTQRAAYTGAIGFFGFDGSASLSIAIRIVEVHGSRLWFQAGGGIVADSDPAREYEETLVKASGIARALDLTLP